jgi:hypothetical protein
MILFSFSPPRFYAAAGYRTFDEKIRMWPLLNKPSQEDGQFIKTEEAL